MKFIFTFGFTLFCFCFEAFAAGNIRTESIRGVDLVRGGKVNVSIAKAKKGTVVVFVSASCPCSVSHESHIRELATQFSDFQFVGVQSKATKRQDLIESGEPPIPVSENLIDRFVFPLVNDAEGKIADEFGAASTPYVVVVSPSGEVFYRGGISNSPVFERAEKFFLRDSLRDVQRGRAVRLEEGRSLGCMITRSNAQDSSTIQKTD